MVASVKRVLPQDNSNMKDAYKHKWMRVHGDQESIMVCRKDTASNEDLLRVLLNQENGDLEKKGYSDKTFCRPTNVCLVGTEESPKGRYQIGGTNCVLPTGNPSEILWTDEVASQERQTYLDAPMTYYDPVLTELFGAFSYDANSFRTGVDIDFPPKQAVQNLATHSKSRWKPKGMRLLKTLDELRTKLETQHFWESSDEEIRITRKGNEKPNKHAIIKKDLGAQRHNEAYFFTPICSMIASGTNTNTTPEAIDKAIKRIEFFEAKVNEPGFELIQELRSEGILPKEYQVIINDEKTGQFIRISLDSLKELRKQLAEKKICGAHQLKTTRKRNNVEEFVYEFAKKHRLEPSVQTQKTESKQPIKSEMDAFIADAKRTIFTEKKINCENGFQLSFSCQDDEGNKYDLPVRKKEDGTIEILIPDGNGLMSVSPTVSNDMPGSVCVNDSVPRALPHTCVDEGVLNLLREKTEQIAQRERVASGFAQVEIKDTLKLKLILDDLPVLPSLRSLGYRSPRVVSVISGKRSQRQFVESGETKISIAARTITMLKPEEKTVYNSETNSSETAAGSSSSAQVTEAVQVATGTQALETDINRYFGQDCSLEDFANYTKKRMETLYRSFKGRFVNHEIDEITNKVVYKIRKIPSQDCPHYTLTLSKPGNTDPRAAYKEFSEMCTSYLFMVNLLLTNKILADNFRGATLDSWEIPTMYYSITTKICLNDRGFWFNENKQDCALHGGQKRKLHITNLVNSVKAAKIEDNDDDVQEPIPVSVPVEDAESNDGDAPPVYRGFSARTTFPKSTAGSSSKSQGPVEDAESNDGGAPPVYRSLSGRTTFSRSTAGSSSKSQGPVEYGQEANGEEKLVDMVDF